MTLQLSQQHNSDSQSVFLDQQHQPYWGVFTNANSQTQDLLNLSRVGSTNLSFIQALLMGQCVSS